MLRHIRVEMLLFSILYVVFGLAFLVATDVSISWVCYGITLAVLVCGVVNLAVYFRAKARRFGALCHLIAGVVTTALGIYTLIRPQTVQVVVPLIFGLLIVVDGLIRLGAGFSFAGRKVEKWWTLVLLGLLSCLLGAGLAGHDYLPLLNLIDPILLCGVLLVAEGVLNLGCTMYTGMTRKQLADAAAAAAEKEGRPPLVEAEIVEGEAAKPQPKPARGPEAPRLNEKNNET